MRHPKTDYGTVILHWLFVAAFGVAFVSGMRIATEAPDRLWINCSTASCHARVCGSRTCRRPWRLWRCRWPM